MSTSQVRIPAEERRQQILELATELFARQGYRGTTTREIAQRVQVNEAIIFRHFPTKEDLYWAVIENQIQIRAGRVRLEAKLAAGGDDRATLTAIAEELLSRDVTLSRLLLYTALENHELSHRFFLTHVAQYLEMLADYIRQGVAEGRFREVDPLLAARGFLGMLVYHFQIQELFGGKRVQTFDPHHVSETLVDLWLKGMERN
ncbi:MAG: TetR/AcrR family transcriptional regulator [Terriglobales bacterium]